MIRFLLQRYLIQGDRVSSKFSLNSWSGGPDWATIADWVIVYFWQLLENYRSSQTWTSIFHSKSKAFISTKNGLGYSLGNFFRKPIWSPCSWPTIVSWSTWQKKFRINIFCSNRFSSFSFGARKKQHLHDLNVKMIVQSFFLEAVFVFKASHRLHCGRQAVNYTPHCITTVTYICKFEAVRIFCWRRGTVVIEPA
jgi:hypothetical protein